jgi:hypothetical protein
MIPDAFKFRNRYADLKMPVVIIAGEQDRLIDIENSVGAAPFRRFAKQVSPSCRKWPHDPADGDGSGDVGDKGSFGRVR